MEVGLGGGVDWAHSAEAIQPEVHHPSSNECSMSQVGCSWDELGCAVLLFHHSTRRVEALHLQPRIRQQRRTNVVMESSRVLLEWIVDLGARLVSVATARRRAMEGEAAGV